MTDTQLAATFFLQVATILAVCRIVGWLAQKGGQPQVVGEMVAGFLMGPSLFGWLAPELQAYLFPPATLRVLFVVSQLGLVLYMFCVGLEFNADLMLRHARRAAAVSIAGIAAPFALGSGLAVLLFRTGGFFTGQVQPFHAVLFVGAAMSITAFPMLARIIYERGITGTALGSLALAAGAMDDAAAWIILGIVVGSFTGSSLLAISAGLGGILYAVFVFGAGRPLFKRLTAAAECQGAVAPWMLASMLSALAFGAWFTDTVGIHAVFGAFVLGVAMPRGAAVPRASAANRTGDYFAAGTAVLRLFRTQFADRSRQLRLAVGDHRHRVPNRVHRKGGRLLGGCSCNRGNTARRPRCGGTHERPRDDGADPAEHRPPAWAHHADAVHDLRADDHRHHADGGSRLRPCDAPSVPDGESPGARTGRDDVRAPA